MADARCLFRRDHLRLLGFPVIIDKRTGEVLEFGTSITRRPYPGRPFRFEVLSVLDDGRLWVRKLDGDRWVYLRVRPESLQLEVQGDAGGDAQGAA